ncbi:MAG: hypothetical protein QOJ50_2960 [Cryptosporangiaceae bacterium]|nr:hypothetical protein [Cryptosporangiaceae bacterium]
MSGRGSVGRGRPAPLPAAAYAPPPPVRRLSGVLEVEFTGEDGRRAVLPVGRLPLPGWHELLAAALSERAGPAGRLRTRASAIGTGWAPVARLVRFLALLPDAPAVPAALATTHLERFWRHRAEHVGAGYAGREVRNISRVLELAPLGGHLSGDVREFLARRASQCGAPKPGYSDGELSRLVAAARRSAAAIRDRIDASERILARRAAGGEPGELEASVAPVLAAAAGGHVSTEAGRPVDRVGLAARLFLTRLDLPPLLVLLVAVTGWNIETIKELPAEHRILDGRAVEVRVIKRRRGSGRWTQTATWEIGPPGRALHTPGGVYLLVHRLAARSRALSGGAGLWSIWRNGHTTGRYGLAEHHDPFARALHANLRCRDWIAQAGVHADPATGMDAESAGQGDGGARGPLLRVDFNRLKTSIDVRRTRATGGHLPSAARTNTIPVLFRHYLRGDPTVLAWAGDVMAEAVADAEHAALAAHRRAAAAAAGGPRIASGAAQEGGVDAGEPAGPAADGAGQDTAWTACTDPEHHPATGQRCQASFLDCFHCGNALITTAHLPRLLALADALATRRAELPEQDWWARYGPAWAAIRHDVLSKFTPGQITAAAHGKPTDALLDLVENPWSHP